MLEVCIDSIEAAEIAMASGANRLEVCSVLEVGGVTPTTPFLKHLRRGCGLPLVALVRCRSGDFVHSDREKLLMMDEVRELCDAGADAVAVGCLLPNGNLDLGFLGQVRALLPCQELVVHRAIDVAKFEDGLISSLRNIGVDRILTSGGADRADEGLDQLIIWNADPHQRIQILPGSGVRPTNARRILEATRCRQLHGSFRHPQYRAGWLPDPSWIAETRAILDDYLRSAP
ncbi:MAG: copper homeostasis protein CutC [Pirellulales bacterium]